MSGRPHCRNTAACVAKTAGKHCSPCTLSAKWADPEFRQKRRDAFRRKFETDPDFKARHVRASAERLREWRKQPGVMAGANERSRANLLLANTPEGLERRRQIIRQQRLGWCPPHRVEEYIRIARRMPAADAKRIILDDEAAQARRQIEAFNRRQRERFEREKAQAY